MPEPPRSCWATFMMPAAPTFRFSPRAAEAWVRLKVETMTYMAVQGLNPSFRVIAKSKTPFRASAWMQLIQLIGGTNLCVEPITKYRTPIQKYGVTQEQMDELQMNLFTLEQNQLIPEKENAPPPNSVVRAKDSLQILFSEDKDLEKIGTLFCTLIGAEMNAGKCKDMQSFWIVETHRRVLMLESLVSGLGNGEGLMESLAPLRALFFHPVPYVLIDIVTLGVPLLMHALQKDNLQMVAGYRMKAVAACIKPMLVYGAELSKRVEATHPTEESQAQLKRVGLVEPFSWLPEAVKLKDSPAVDLGDILRRRVANEQEIVRNVALRFNISATAPLMLLYTRTVTQAPAILLADTWERKYSEHLPATTSMPTAKYALHKFLELSEHL